MAFTPEDFARVADQFKNTLNDHDAVVYGVKRKDLNIILAALHLAPVGLAAIAYHDRGYEPSSGSIHDAWRVLDRAVTAWREKETANAGA